MGKHPAMPLYVKDLLTDEQVILMGYEALGVYVTLLAHEWNEGSIPAGEAVLALLLRLPLRKFTPIWTRIRDRFEPQNSAEQCVERLVNRRLEEERDKLNAYSDSRRKGAQARWNASRGEVHADSTCDAHASAHADASHMPSSSSSSSSSFADQDPPCSPPKGGDDPGKDNQQINTGERKRKRRTAPAEEPLPFAIDEAWRILQRCCSRVIEPADFEARGAEYGKIFKNLIRSFPDQATWQLVGEWLGQGGDYPIRTIDVWAIRAKFATWVTSARKWDAEGRRPISVTSQRPRDVTRGRCVDEA